MKHACFDISFTRFVFLTCEYHCSIYSYNERGLAVLYSISEELSNKFIQSWKSFFHHTTCMWPMQQRRPQGICVERVTEISLGHKKFPLQAFEDLSGKSGHNSFRKFASANVKQQKNCVTYRKVAKLRPHIPDQSHPPKYTKNIIKHNDCSTTAHPNAWEASGSIAAINSRHGSINSAS